MLDIGTNIITKNKVPLGHGYASSYLKSCTTDLPGRSINAVIHFQISLLHIITVLLVFFCIVCFFSCICVSGKRKEADSAFGCLSNPFEWDIITCRLTNKEPCQTCTMMNFCNDESASIKGQFFNAILFRYHLRLMLIDVDWYVDWRWLMLIGADWCWLMLIDKLADADWYWLIC